MLDCNCISAHAHGIDRVTHDFTHLRESSQQVDNAVSERVSLEAAVRLHRLCCVGQ